MTTPGERIKALRESLREEGAPVTQPRLAEMAEVALRTVQSWEADARAPTGENLVRLARALGTIPSYITDGQPVDPRVSGEVRERHEKLTIARWLRLKAEELEREAMATLPPESPEKVDPPEVDLVDVVNRAGGPGAPPAGRRGARRGRG